MHIYEIRNLSNGKRYIGQTKLSPHKRKSSHWSNLRHGTHTNIMLQRAWNKYGESQFVFSTIVSANNLEELNQLEIDFVCKNVNGYNIRSGGVFYTHSKETKKKISMSKIDKPNGQKGSTRKPLDSIHRQNLVGRTYENVVCPHGIVYPIENLREFCRVHNLSQPGLRSVVVTKVTFHYKGWRLATDKTTDIKFSDESLENRGRNISTARRPNGYPDVISPDGTIYSVEHLSQFCELHKLSKGLFSMLLNGKKDTYKQWRVAT